MKTVLITGGAGFIGINTASHYINKNFKVIILDNFSRKGVEKNIEWFKKSHKKGYSIIKYDLRHKSSRLDSIVREADIIFHFAGQVAVTTSVLEPYDDFLTNALGTLHLLESIRKSKKNPILVYSSTNKVYGDLEGIAVKELKTRYAFKELLKGVDEKAPLDFHSPYGCSKGCADQYIRDYSRIYGIRSVVFRQSCIYGPHQYGYEDQGWVAWFLIAGVLGKKISIYGSGKQVRDLLHVDDLIRAYDLAINNIKITNGQIYNIGGGYDNSLSIWLEFGPLLESLLKKKLNVKFAKTRPGDQAIFIADTTKAKRDFGWKPKINLTKGIKNLYEWIKENESEFT